PTELYTLSLHDALPIYTLTTKMGAYKYSAEPRGQIFAPLKIVHAKGGGSEKLSIRMRNPCNRQLISIQVRLQFFDSSLRGSFPRSEEHTSELQSRGHLV